MLQFRLSLSRQSNPSIRTTGLFPKFPRMQPAFLAEDDGGDGTDSGGFSSPNRASCVNGLETLLGGDPQKNGGDDATCVLLCSILEAPSVRMISKKSVPGFDS